MKTIYIDYLPDSIEEIEVIRDISRSIGKFNNAVIEDVCSILNSYIYTDFINVEDLVTEIFIKNEDILQRLPSLIKRSTIRYTESSLYRFINTIIDENNKKQPKPIEDFKPNVGTYMNIPIKWGGLDAKIGYLTIPRMYTEKGERTEKIYIPYPRNVDPKSVVSAQITCCNWEKGNRFVVAFECESTTLPIYMTRDYSKEGKNMTIYIGGVENLLSFFINSYRALRPKSNCGVIASNFDKDRSFHSTIDHSSRNSLYKISTDEFEYADRISDFIILTALAKDIHRIYIKHSQVDGSITPETAYRAYTSFHAKILNAIVEKCHLYGIYVKEMRMTNCYRPNGVVRKNKRKYDGVYLESELYRPCENEPMKIYSQTNVALNMMRAKDETAPESVKRFFAAKNLGENDISQSIDYIYLDELIDRNLKLINKMRPKNK